MFPPPALALCPESTKRQTQSHVTKTTGQKWTSTPAHTERAASPRPCCWIALLYRCLLHKYILFPCLFWFLFLSFPPQSQTAAGGQSDVPLKPQEFIVGESTGERLIVSPSVQSALSACHIDLPPSTSPTPRFSIWRCMFPADVPPKHMLRLWVGFHLSLQRYLLLFSFCTNPHRSFSSRLWLAGFDNSSQPAIYFSCHFQQIRH